MKCGRYAPSPSGPLHLGNLRTALLAWLQTRLAGGEFILRIDDLDEPRTITGATEQALADLRWLGIDWDVGPDHKNANQPVQSKRKSYYQAAFEELKDADAIFPCWCSRKDIAMAASAPHGYDNVSIYPGTCRNAESVNNHLGQAAAWRYRVDDQVISFDDQLAGHYAQQLAQDVGDFVIKRKDGLFAYHLASVVDDGLMGVTDVVRGQDLLASTPRQIALYQALGFDLPTFWHVPIMNDEKGQRMAKRDGSASLDSRRERGDNAADVIGMLAASCRLIPNNEPLSAAELLQSLSLQSFRQKLRT